MTGEVLDLSFLDSILGRLLFCVDSWAIPLAGLPAFDFLSR
jgi:hypothetical protein